MNYTPFFFDVYISSHVIVDYLFDVVILSDLLQLPKVIDQRSHAGGKVKNTVHQLTEGDLACKRLTRVYSLYVNGLNPASQLYLVFGQSPSHRSQDQQFPAS